MKTKTLTDKTRPLIRKLVASAIRGNDLAPEELPEVLALMEAVTASAETPEGILIPDPDQPETDTDPESAENAPGSKSSEEEIPGETAADADPEILSRLDRIIELLETRLPQPAADSDPLAEAAEALTPADLLPESSPAAALETEMASLLGEAGEEGVTPAEFLDATLEAAEETARAGSSPESWSEAVSALDPEAGAEAGSAASREAADAMIRGAVRALRPIIAALPAAHRSSAADAALRALKAGSLPVRRRAGDRGAYANLVRASRPADDGALGRRIIAQRNVNAKK